ncbi:hypothetical protein RI367_007067 [Sorochytrium milnesiophthora]
MSSNLNSSSASSRTRQPLQAVALDSLAAQPVIVRVRAADATTGNTRVFLATGTYLLALSCTVAATSVIGAKWSVKSAASAPPNTPILADQIAFLFTYAGDWAIVIIAFLPTYAAALRRIRFLIASFTFGVVALIAFDLTGIYSSVLIPVLNIHAIGYSTTVFALAAANLAVSFKGVIPLALWMVQRSKWRRRSNPLADTYHPSLATPARSLSADPSKNSPFATSLLQHRLSASSDQEAASSAASVPPTQPQLAMSSSPSLPPTRTSMLRSAMTSPLQKLSLMRRTLSPQPTASTLGTTATSRAAPPDLHFPLLLTATFLLYVAFHMSVYVSGLYCFYPMAVVTVSTWTVVFLKNKQAPDRLTPAMLFEYCVCLAFAGFIFPGLHSIPALLLSSPVLSNNPILVIIPFRLIMTWVVYLIEHIALVGIGNVDLWRSIHFRFAKELQVLGLLYQVITPTVLIQYIAIHAAFNVIKDSGLLDDLLYRYLSQYWIFSRHVSKEQVFLLLRDLRTQIQRSEHVLFARLTAAIVLPLATLLNDSVLPTMRISKLDQTIKSQQLVWLTCLATVLEVLLARLVSVVIFRYKQQKVSELMRRDKVPGSDRLPRLFQTHLWESKETVAYVSLCIYYYLWTAFSE